ncbi:MAG: hypothetical protein KGL39_35270, partial [Patescibacteria group bacterium]|nr:hypothetical protein [Patescibacteria group bacterium]
MNNQPDTVPDQSVFQAGPTLGPPGIPGAPVAVGTVEEARDALFLAIDRFAFREAKLPEQSKVFQAVHDF